MCIFIETDWFKSQYVFDFFSNFNFEFLQISRTMIPIFIIYLKSTKVKMKELLKIGFAKLNYMLILTVSTLIAIASCSSNEDNFTEVPDASVSITNTIHPKLSDYNFFKGDQKLQIPVDEILPYEPISSLFTDYAKKKRFVYIPKNKKANYTADDQPLNLPIGSALIKTFYYNQVLPSNTARIIETRVMIRRDTGWVFAEYVWNEQQTEAYLQMGGSTTAVSFQHNGAIQAINYEIPSEGNCATCHNSNLQAKPIGIKPQSLNRSYLYAEGSINQLTKWVEKGFLENSLPSTINSVVNYSDASQNINLRARSYFDINCAHCHHDGGSAEYVNLRFGFSDSSNFENLGVNQAAGIPVPGVSHGLIVAPQNALESSLYYMMNTNNPTIKMPRLGRTIVDQEGVALVEAWINSLDN